MTEIILRNAIPKSAGNIALVWDSIKHNNATPITIDGENQFLWSDYNLNTDLYLAGDLISFTNYSNTVGRPYVVYNLFDPTFSGGIYYYGNTVQQFQDVFIICRVRNDEHFAHVISLGANQFMTDIKDQYSTTKMTWSGIELSVIHDAGTNHTCITCRVGRNYVECRTNSFDFNAIHCFSIENADTVNNVVFKWNNTELCTIANITNGVGGYTNYNCNMISNRARYIQLGSGNIAGFNIPHHSVLHDEQNGVRECYAIGVGKITSDLMHMFYLRYSVPQDAVNLNTTTSGTIDGTLGTIFGTTTTFSGTIQIL
jgi:hypothetical protein